MKRILLSLFAVALAVVLGQTFSVTPSDTIHYTSIPAMEPRSISLPEYLSPTIDPEVEPAWG
ncbi:MAG: hypothetical protein U0176_09335 [Bacteroidia bacterium]